MWELVNLGCIHKDGYNWCRGKWDPNRPSIPLMLRNNQRWFDQIRAQLQGGEFDYDVSKRPANAQRLLNDIQLGNQERSKIQPSVSASSLGAVEILRRNPDISNLRGNCVDAIGPDGTTPSEWYEEMVYPVLSVNAVGGASKAKGKGPQSAKEIMRQRARAEEKLPQAKGQRSTTLGVRKENSPPQDLDIDPLSEDGGEDPDDLDRTLDHEKEEERESPRKLTKKPTVPLPKQQKGVKMLIEALKTPDPVATIQNQWMKDNQAYMTILGMGNAVATHMAQEIQKTTGVAAVANGLGRMIQKMGQPAQVTGAEHLLQGNAATFDFRTLIAKKNIVTSPRLRFVLQGPLGEKQCHGMIDTGAECNILPKETARTLGCVIHDVEGFRLSTATGDEFGFDGLAKVRIEIAEGVSCEDVFFLVEGAPKILLGQPFVGRMKMSIIHREDGSWDGKFINLTNPTSTCTIMIVPPLKSIPKKTVHFRQEL
jgi:hypothetical protein